VKVWVTQLRKGLLEYCVLNLLAHGEAYGYEIAQRLKALDELAVTESTLYPILTRLREEGYLQVRATPSPDGPPRRYFSLTLLGKQRVEQMNGYWDQLHTVLKRLRSGELTEGGQ
jgi:PadR family transcriptional regulator, regulatory protein PadR